MPPVYVKQCVLCVIGPLSSYWLFSSLFGTLFKPCLSGLVFQGIASIFSESQHHRIFRVRRDPLLACLGLQWAAGRGRWAEQCEPESGLNAVGSHCCRMNLGKAGASEPSSSREVQDALGPPGSLPSSMPALCGATLLLEGGAGHPASWAGCLPPPWLSCPHKVTCTLAPSYVFLSQ